MYVVVLKENKSDARIELYLLALSYFENSPLINQIFGHGIVESRQYFESMTSHGSIHCAYLQALTYYGILGVVFMLLFLISQIKSGIKIWRRNRYIS